MNDLVRIKYKDSENYKGAKISRDFFNDLMIFQKLFSDCSTNKIAQAYLIKQIQSETKHETSYDMYPQIVREVFELQYKQDIESWDLLKRKCKLFTNIVCEFLADWEDKDEFDVKIRMVAYLGLQSIIEIPKQTKEEFIQEYLDRSAKNGIERDIIMNTQVVLPCECNYFHCSGWTMVSNNELSIKAHNDLYNPETK